MEKTTTATLLRFDLAEILRNLHTGPVTITKHGKIVAILSAPTLDTTDIDDAAPSLNKSLKEDERDVDSSMSIEATVEESIEAADEEPGGISHGDDWFEFVDAEDSEGEVSTGNDEVPDRASEEDWRVALLAARDRLANNEAMASTQEG